MSAGTGKGSAAKRAQLDPDRLAALEEERDFLLRSMDDLDRELAAGDVTDADHAVLRDDYTARAAEVLRAIEDHRDAVERAAPRPSRWRTAGILAAVLAASVAVGVVLANVAGVRGSGGTATGTAGTLRERLAECQPLAFQEAERGIRCYDDILRTSPDNTEALTYRGWARIRSGDGTGGDADLARVIQLDPRYPDAYVFRAVSRKRAGDWAGAKKELDAFYALDPPKGAQSILEQMGTEYEIEYQLLDPSVRTCFDLTQQFLQANGDGAGSTTTTTTPPRPTPTLLDILRCLDSAAAARPGDPDPLLLRGFLLATSGVSELVAQAGSTIDRAVAAAPADPTARLLRAAYRNQNGDAPGALADLDALAAMGRPSVLYGIAPASELRAAAESALASTSVPSPTTSAGGR